MNALEIYKSRGDDRLFDSWENVAREFDKFFSSRGANLSTSNELAKPLTCDIEETNSNYLLTFDIPGISEEDVDIEIEGKSLRISGERKKSTTSNESGLHRSERVFGRFERRFEMPDLVDTKGIEAHYDSGVLTLSLPKTEVAKPRKVQISSGKKGFLRSTKS